MGRAERAELLITHFCKINSCTKELFEEHYAKAQEKKYELEMRYGASIGKDNIDYGKYNNRILQSRQRRESRQRQGQHQLDWWQAVQRALKYATGRGLHPNYHEEIIELVKDDKEFREKLTAYINNKNFDDSYQLITEALQEAREGGFLELLPDHELLYAPNGDLYGHHWPGE
jgi:DNA replication protein DnaD